MGSSLWFAHCAYDIEVLKTFEAHYCWNFPFSSGGKKLWEIIFIPIFILRGGRFPVIGTLCRRHWGIELPTKSHSAAERTTETNENQSKIKFFSPLSVQNWGLGKPLLRKTLKKTCVVFWMSRDQQREALELTEGLTGQQQCGRKTDNIGYSFKKMPKLLPIWQQRKVLKNLTTKRSS